MKKLLLTLGVAFVCVCANAQKGDKSVGVNLSYGTEISNLGIGVKGNYGLTDNIRVEAGFDYFLEKDGMKFWDINVNAHYLFPLSDKLKVYPLAGISFSHFNAGSVVSIDGIDSFEDYQEAFGEGVSREDYDESLGASLSSSKFGVNLGAGVQYDLDAKWAINGEVKYQLISDFNQAVFSVGLVYKL